MYIIGLKELRLKPNHYATLVRQGKSFVVVKRSKPLFKITPLDTEEGLWEEVIDFTKIKRGGVRLQDLLKRL